MAFVRKRDYSGILKTVKVELGTLLGLEKDEDVYVTLKEPDTHITLELRKIADQGEEALLECFAKHLPDLMVDHNFYDDEELKEKLTNHEVLEIILAKTEVFAKVANTYTDAVFTSRPSQRSEK